MVILHLYTILRPALLKLGRNDPGPKRLRAETTHQISPQKAKRPGRAETPGPYSMAWSYISFKYQKIMADKEP